MALNSETFLDLQLLSHPRFCIFTTGEFTVRWRHGGPLDFLGTLIQFIENSITLPACFFYHYCKYVFRWCRRWERDGLFREAKTTICRGYRNFVYIEVYSNTRRKIPILHYPKHVSQNFKRQRDTEFWTGIQDSRSIHQSDNARLGFGHWIAFWLGFGPPNRFLVGLSSTGITGYVWFGKGPFYVMDYCHSMIFSKNPKLDILPMKLSKPFKLPPQPGLKRFWRSFCLFF
jgi:hypothetical protein